MGVLTEAREGFAMAKRTGPWRHEAIAVAALAMLAATSVCAIASAQETPPDQASSVRETPQSQEAFEHGLAAANAGRFESAVEYFERAAKGGDVGDPNFVSPSRLWSGRQEVWFNLALAQSRVRGLELSAIAGFKAYLILNPAAENAPAVYQQIRALEERAVADIRQAITNVQRLVAPRPFVTASIPYPELIAVMTSRDVGVAVADTYLYLGEREPAVTALDRHLGPIWRDQTSDFSANTVVAAGYDDVAWAMIPHGRLNQLYPYLHRARYLMETGRMAEAHRLLAEMRAANIRPSAGVPSDVGGVWEALACTARDAGDAQLLRDLIQASVNWDPDGVVPGSSRVGLLVELGEIDRAREMAGRVQHGRDVAMDYLSGQRPADICEQHWVGFSYGRWWGSARLTFLQEYALYAERIADRITRTSEPRVPQRSAQAVRDIAADYRRIHGP